MPTALCVTPINRSPGQMATWAHMVLLSPFSSKPSTTKDAYFREFRHSCSIHKAVADTWSDHHALLPMTFEASVLQGCRQYVLNYVVNGPKGSANRPVVRCPYQLVWCFLDSKSIKASQIQKSVMAAIDSIVHGH